MVWIPRFDYWGLGLIPGLGTRILQVSRCGKQTNKQNLGFALENILYSTEFIPMVQFTRRINFIRF